LLDLSFGKGDISKGEFSRTGIVQGKVGQTPTIASEGGGLSRRGGGGRLKGIGSNKKTQKSHRLFLPWKEKWATAKRRTICLFSMYRPPQLLSGDDLGVKKIL